MVDKIKNQFTENPYIRAVFIVIAATFAIYFLKELSLIFIPLSLAIFFTFLFGPLISFMSKRKVPNFIIMILILIVVSVLLFLLGTIVYASVTSFANEFPKYQDKFIVAYQGVMSQLKIPVEDAEYFFQNKLNWFELANRISLQKFITSTMGSFFDFVTTLVVMVLLMMFMVAERKNLSDRLEALLRKKNTKMKPGIVEEMQKKIQTYVSRKTIISLGTALSAMIIASFFKLDFIIIIGLITFILNFIPNIGSIIATIFPIGIYLLQYGFDGNFVLMSILLITSQFLFGNVLDPRYLGQGLKLSPLFIIVSLFFWNWLWGPIGMILCVPLQSIIALILQNTGGALTVRALMGETLEEGAPAMMDKKE